MFMLGYLLYLKSRTGSIFIYIMTCTFEFEEGEPVTRPSPIKLNSPLI